MKNILLLIFSLLCAVSAFAQPCDFTVYWEVSQADCPELTLTVIPQGGAEPFIVETVPSGPSYNIAVLGDSAFVFLPIEADSVIITDALGASCFWVKPDWNGPIQPGTWDIVQPSCSNASDGQITILPTGGYGNLTTFWNGPFGSSGQGTSLQNLNQGLYSFTFMDAFGCSYVDSWNLQAEFSADLAVVGDVANASCQNNMDGSIDLTVFGGCAPYEYLWNNGVPFEDLSNLTPGSYEVTITDCNGCTITENYSVVEPTSITVAVVSSPGCIDEINIAGGCPPYLLSVNGVSIPGLPYCDLESGEYTVQVTDNCGCEQISNVSIVGNTMVLTAELTLPTCTFTADGAIDLTVTGGQPGYSFAWNNAASTEDLSGLTQGIYTVTVTDADGITQTAEFDLKIPSLMFESAITCESIGGVDGAISITMMDYGSPYTFYWSNGSLDQNQTNMNSGIYNLTVTNVFGCESILPPFFVCHDSMALNMDTIVCAGTEILLDAQFDDEIDFLGWTDMAGNEIDCASCPMTMMYPHSSTTVEAMYNSVTFGAFQYSFDIQVIEGCVWPGDTDSSTVVDHFDLFPICLAYGATGPARVDQDIDWYGHPADDFGILLPGGIDAKHVDCDGGGSIALQDTMAVILNWGETHKSDGDEKEVGVPVYVAEDTIYEQGATISLPIMIGLPDLMAEEVYAVGFSIHFNPEIMVNGTAGIELVDSWLSQNSPNMGIVNKEFADMGRVDLAIGRTDLQNTSGYGQVASFIITMEDDIMKPTHQAFDIIVKDVRMIDKNGNELDAYGQPSTSYYIDSTLVNVIDLSSDDPTLQIFPNPTTAGEELQIISSRAYDQFELFNSNGQLVQNSQLNKRKLSLNKPLTPGLYIIRLKGEQGIVSRKLLVL